MRLRLTKTERAAAMFVAATAAGVAAAGIKLIRKHTKYTLEKAAAFFAKEDEETETTAEEAQEGEEQS